MAASAASPPTSRVLAPLPNIITDSPNNSPVPASSPTSTQSLTAKQWVVPPRPKPGRKPAVDTPPTKRKAQNRAAQRAFRERRAAKVGELEDQMDELEREHASALDNLQAEMDGLKKTFDEHLKQTIGTYESDLRNTELELSNWKAKYQDLEVSLDGEQRRREAVEKELAILTGQAVRLPFRSTEADQSHYGTDISDAQQAYSTPEETSIGCGRCSAGTRCQCVEEVFEVELGTTTEPGQQGKRPPSPSAILGPGKRSKIDSSAESRDTLEIDFTTSQLNLPRLLPEPTSSNLEFTSNGPIPLADSCGFCQDGGPCACAQYAADKQRASRLLSPPLEAKPDLAPASNLITSPPIPQPQTPNNCTSDPGNCNQCRTNPSSTLFCKSLASNRAATATAAIRLPPPIRSLNSTMNAAPCPAGLACCRVSNLLDKPLPCPPTTLTSSRSGFAAAAPTTTTTTNQSTITGPTLSCADAFTTLSRHRAFERASMDFNEWLPRLVTIPVINHDANPTEERDSIRRGSTSGHDLRPSTRYEKKRGGDGGDGRVDAAAAADDTTEGGRTAFEIEAASVMGVMRYFDRRFPSVLEDGGVGGGSEGSEME